MRFKPGERVIVTENGWNPTVTELCEASKGSTGVILSFEEYQAEYLQEHKNDQHLAWLKKQIQNGRAYPIRYETVAPLDPAEDGILIIEPGEITTLSLRFIKLLKEE